MPYINRADGPERRLSPVTITDLIREGKLLEIGCLDCGRHVYADPARAGLPDELDGGVASGPGFLYAWRKAGEAIDGSLEDREA